MILSRLKRDTWARMKRGEVGADVKGRSYRARIDLTFGADVKGAHKLARSYFISNLNRRLPLNNFGLIHRSSYSASIIIYPSLSYIILL